MYMYKDTSIYWHIPPENEIWPPKQDHDYFIQHFEIQPAEGHTISMESSHVILCAKLSWF